MSVNLKGADKEPPTEEIYITETLQAPQAENTEPVTKQSRRQSWSTILIIHIRTIR